MAIPTISDIAGLLTEPELRFTGSGKAVANVRVAFNDSRYNDQTRQFETTKAFYVDCTAWEHTAERLTEHFRKGDQVYIEGRIETEEWEHEGQKRSKPNLTIRTIRKLEKAQSQPQSAPQGAAQGNWNNAPANAWGGGQQQGQGNTPPPF